MPCHAIGQDEDGGRKETEGSECNKSTEDGKRQERMNGDGTEREGVRTWRTVMMFWAPRSRTHCTARATSVSSNSNCCTRCTGSSTSSSSAAPVGPSRSSLAASAGASSRQTANAASTTRSPCSDSARPRLATRASRYCASAAVSTRSFHSRTTAERRSDKSSVGTACPALTGTAASSTGCASDGDGDAASSATEAAAAALVVAVEALAAAAEGACPTTPSSATQGASAGIMRATTRDTVSSISLCACPCVRCRCMCAIRYEEGKKRMVSSEREKAG
jgi:hypothetical protein